MTKIQKTLLIVHICLTIPFVLVCAILLVDLYTTVQKNKENQIYYQFKEDEYTQVSYYQIEKPTKYLGRKRTPVGSFSSKVYQLDGLYVEEFLGCLDVSLFPHPYLIVREGVDEPLLRYPLEKLKVDGSSKVCSLENIDLTSAFRNGTPYDRDAVDPERFSRRSLVTLYFDLPCELDYWCTLAQEAESGSLYFLYELIDWEAEVPELAPGETMDWPTQTYICEVTDLLADRLPKDFWE